MALSKPFTSEHLRRKEAPQAAAPQAAPAGAPVAGGPSNREVLDAIASLRKELQDAGVIGKSESDIAAENSEINRASADAARQRAEVRTLKTEIHGLSRLIQETKAQIAAIRLNDPEQDRILAMTNELDAVVAATEGATNTILAVAEKVDDLAQRIRLHASDETERQTAEEISEQIMQVYEACNFQDLTGQRISKVVNTMKYIEERINSMIDIWGADDLAELSGDESGAWDRDRHMLNGPQLEDRGISQDEIDRLFD